MNLLKYFLKYRKQRVLLNALNSSWKGITSDVLQGSILGPFVLDLYKRLAGWLVAEL